MGIDSLIVGDIYIIIQSTIYITTIIIIDVVIYSVVIVVTAIGCNCKPSEKDLRRKFNCS